MNIQIGELIRLHSRLAVTKDNLDIYFSSVNRELDDIRINVQTSGLNENIINLSEEISGVQRKLSVYLENLLNFLYSQMESYKTTNEEARQTLENLITILNNGLNPSVIKSDAVHMKNEVDISVYNNYPEMGFIVTTDNKKYELSDKDKDFVYAVLASEAWNTSYDDALATMSVILNRADANNMDPVSIIKRPNQFEGYYAGYYLKFLNGNTNEVIRKAADDALNGVRNCNYYSFRGPGENYGSNQVCEHGNKYK